MPTALSLSRSRPERRSSGLTGAHFEGEDGWVGYTDGFVARTTGRGQSWHFWDIGSRGPVLAFATSAGGQRVLAAAGRTWERLGENLAVFCDARCWLVSGGVLWRAEPAGGERRFERLHDFEAQGPEELPEVAAPGLAPGERNGWVALVEDGRGRVLHTVDGGRSFTEVARCRAGAYAEDRPVYVSVSADAQRIWITAPSLLWLKLRDGGASFKPMDVPVPGDHREVCASPDEALRLLYTEDALFHRDPGTGAWRRAPFREQSCLAPEHHLWIADRIYVREQ
jgi:hypothetical protein